MPGVERLGQRFGEDGLEPGATGQDLVRADGEHRAYLGSRHERADSAGVAAQQAEPVGVAVGGLDVFGAVGADPGVTPVDGPSFGELRGGLVGGGGAVEPFGGKGDRGIGACDVRDVRRTGSEPVQGDRPRRHQRAPYQALYSAFRPEPLT